MTKPITSSKRSLRLDAADYLSWIGTGNIPASLEPYARKHPLILVDEGYDHLNLGRLARAKKQIAKTIVAYDQRKPFVRDPSHTLPAIRSKRYFKELYSACTANRYLGFGPIDDFISNIVLRDKVSLSIVITYHNRAHFIPALLDAFQAQDRTDFELVIVDNGSADILDLSNYKYKLPFQLRYIKNMNAYPGFARNIGAQVASGELIAFFDDDNIPKPNFISQMITAGTNPNHDLVLCMRDLFVTKKAKTHSRGVLLSAPHVKYANAFRNYMGDNVFVMKRALFLELRYTDFFEVGREDIEFLQNARDQGLRLAVMQNDLYLYRLSNSDKIGNKHLTHRTKDTTIMDYGAYRKYYRSSSSFSERKFNQITDNVASLMQDPTDQTQSLLNRIGRGLKRRVSRLPFARRLYYWILR